MSTVTTAAAVTPMSDEVQLSQSALTPPPAAMAPRGVAAAAVAAMVDGISVETRAIMEDAARTAQVDAAMDTACALPEEPVTDPEAIAFGEKMANTVANPMDAEVEKGLAKIEASPCSLRLLPVGEEFDPYDESFECATAQPQPKWKNAVSGAIDGQLYGVVIHLISDYADTLILCQTCDVRFGHPRAMAAVMSTYPAGKFNWVMKTKVARMLILYPQEMKRLWELFPSDFNDRGKVSVWNEQIGLLFENEELVTDSAPDYKFEERGLPLLTEKQKNAVRSEFHVFNTLWGETFKRIADGDSTLYDVPEPKPESLPVKAMVVVLDPETLTAPGAAHSAYCPKADKWIGDDGEGSDPRLFNQEEFEKINAAIEAEKFQSSLNTAAASRLAALFASCDEKAAECRENIRKSASSSAAAAAAEVDLDAVNSDDDDEMVEASAIPDTDSKKSNEPDPEPEKRLQLSPEAAAKQAAYVAEMIAQHNAYLTAKEETATVERNAKKAAAFLCKADAAESVKRKVTILVSDDEAKVPHATQYDAKASAAFVQTFVATVPDVDTAPTTAKKVKSNESGPQLKPTKARPISNLAFRGTVIFDGDHNRIRKDSDGKLSKPIVSTTKGSAVYSLISDLNEYDRVQVTVRKVEDACVVLADLKVLEPSVVPEVCMYDSNTRRVCMSNGKYVPVETYSETATRVLDSIDGTGSHRIAFAVSNLTASAVIVTAASLLS